MVSRASTVVLFFVGVVSQAQTSLNECKPKVESEKFIVWGDTTGEQVWFDVSRCAVCCLPKLVMAPCVSSQFHFRDGSTWWFWVREYNELQSCPGYARTCPTMC